MEYPVLYGDDQMGTVTVTEQGGRTQIEVSCRRSNAGLFRAYLLCQKGEYPLGVLEPRGDRLSLRRTVLTNGLKNLGTIWRGEARMSYAFAGRSQWQSVEAAEQFFQKTPHFSEALAELRGALWQRAGDNRLLALPYECSQPFPLPELFCLARIMAVDGKTYVVYAFDREEQPVLPKNSAQKGTEN